MSKFVLSRAMGAVPDDMLLETTEIKKKSRSGWAILRAAACLAVVIGLLLGLGDFGGESGIVTMPGVVKVYACDAEGLSADELEKYRLVENLEQSYKTLWSPYKSIYSRGIAICLEWKEDSLENSDVVIEVSTNWGELKCNHYKDKYFVEGDLEQSRKNAKLGKKGTIEKGEVVYWTGFELNQICVTGNENGKTNEESLSEIGEIYIDFTVRVNNHIVGYAVMEVVAVDYEGFIFGIELRESAYFPMVDGEFQNVTQKYLEERIQSAKGG